MNNRRLFIPAAFITAIYQMMDALSSARYRLPVVPPPPKQKQDRDNSGSQSV